MGGRSGDQHPTVSWEEKGREGPGTHVKETRRKEPAKSSMCFTETARRLTEFGFCYTTGTNAFRTAYVSVGWGEDVLILTNY